MSAYIKYIYSTMFELYCVNLIKARSTRLVVVIIFGKAYVQQCTAEKSFGRNDDDEVYDVKYYFVLEMKLFFGYKSRIVFVFFKQMAVTMRPVQDRKCWFV